MKQIDQHMGMSSLDSRASLGASPYSMMARALQNEPHSAFGRSAVSMASHAAPTSDFLSDANGQVDLDLVERLTGISPELVLVAYENGQFPMAEDRDATRLSWIEPAMRGVIKTHQFNLPRRLARTVKSSKYQVTCNLAFDAVLAACGAEVCGRPDTWINDQIRILYGALHRMGFAHSIEVWDDTRLVGGLYGIALHGAFFGESMFSIQRDASKVALVHLLARMNKSKMRLLDCQFSTPNIWVSSVRLKFHRKPIWICWTKHRTTAHGLSRLCLLMKCISTFGTLQPSKAYRYNHDGPS